jgi:hypothetical protein
MGHSRDINAHLEACRPSSLFNAVDAAAPVVESATEASSRLPAASSETGAGRDMQPYRSAAEDGQSFECAINLLFVRQTSFVQHLQ